MLSQMERVFRVPGHAMFFIHLMGVCLSSVRGKNTKGRTADAVPGLWRPVVWQGKWSCGR